nr:reverse transcriptase domain-containing protein [Tanacetum cinerariifolium]
GITTRSGTAYQGPMILTASSSLPPVVERETEMTKDTVHPTNNRSTKYVQPLVVQTKTLIQNFEPVVAPTIEPVVAPVKTITSHNIQFRSTSRYSANYNDMTVNRIDVIDMACEEYSQEVLGFSNVITSGNPTPYYDLIVSTSSPTLTPFGDSDFLLEEVDAFPALEDDPTSPEVDHSYFDLEGDILLLEAFLNDDPSLPPPNQGNYLPQVQKELKICEAKTDKSSIDEPPEVKLKDLPPYLEYAFLEGDDKLQVIIAKDLSVEEKTVLITVLKSHKRAIAWKLFDIKETDAFLAIDDEPISLKIDDCYYDSKGDILLLEEFLNDDPLSPSLPPQELKVVEPTNEKSSIDEPPVVELKDLPPLLEYAFLEGDDKLPIS